FAEREATEQTRGRRLSRPPSAGGGIRTGRRPKVCKTDGKDFGATFVRDTINANRAPAEAFPRRNGAAPQSFYL
ncbi:MAG: hypothetical protein K2L28_06920, partial [Muribaculaceae bacterium]|nr:hypothetical protein [Muribaculaceae bacterium]